MADVAWYVVAARHGRTIRAFNEIEALNYAVYMPMEKFIRRARGRRIETETALLGRYMFVGLDESQDFPSIQRARDVDHILSNDAGPLRINPGFIAELMAREARGEFDHTRKPAKVPLAKGDSVQIREDAFEGLYAGAIGELKRAKGRTQWEMILASNGAKLLVTEDQVEHIHRDAA